MNAENRQVRLKWGVLAAALTPFSPAFSPPTANSSQFLGLR
jgi:hypothetical protein